MRLGLTIMVWGMMMCILLILFTEGFYDGDEHRDQEWGGWLNMINTQHGYAIERIFIRI